MEQHPMSDGNVETPPMIDECLHNLFTRQVQARPNAPAVCAWDGDLSYDELDTAAEELAQRLTTLGVKPEVLVPICMEKSLWNTVAMLAVLKAGGGFVPLDPEAPIGRLHDIVRQTRARVNIVDTKTSELFHELDNLELVIPKPLGKDANHVKTSNGVIAHTAKSHNVAYVIFTSGSTGVAKGVVMEHRAVCSSVTAHGKAMYFSEQTRACQFSSLSFDAIIAEVFTTLVHGGCICILSEEQRLSSLATAMTEMRVNWSFLTPLVAVLINPSDVPSLQTLVLGGDAIPQDLITKWVAQDQIVLLQGYGPTETAVFVTSTSRLTSNSKASILGRAIGCSIWVSLLNEDNPGSIGPLAPTGEIGELLIGGPQLAREYLNDEEKTNSAFIKGCSWLKDPETRLYRTGDLVRLHNDGLIEFIGRKDSQAKIRGQRIELGEIEHRIEEQESVHTCAALLPKQGPSSGKLTAIVHLNNHRLLQVGSNDVATWTPLQGQARDLAIEEIHSLRASVSGYLTGAMVPTVWIAMTNMPSTISGKLDRKRLAQWLENMDEHSYQAAVTVDQKHEAELSHETEAGVVGPLTAHEEILQQFCGDVLRLQPEQVIITRSFVGLGGDSIGAMQLASTLRVRGLRLSVQDILRCKSLLELAKRVTEANKPQEQLGASTEPFTLLPEGVEAIIMSRLSHVQDFKIAMIEDAYACAPVQKGVLIGQSKNPSLYITEYIFEVIPRPGFVVDVPKLGRSWQTVTRRHPILRTTFLDSLPGEGFYQIVWREMPARVSIGNTGDSNDPDSQTGAITSSDHWLHIEESDNGHVIGTLKINHALIDGVSAVNLLTELSEIYDDGSPPDHESHYSSYVKFLLSRPKNAEQSYWLEYLSGIEPVHFPRLSDDWPSGEQPEFLSQELRFEHLALELKEFCKIHDLTLSTLIHTVWACVLAFYTGSDDVCFGYVTSGRDLPVHNVEKIVGPVLNMLISRIHIGSQTGLELAEERREDFTRSLEHQLFSLMDCQHSLGLDGETLFNSILSVQSFTDDAVEGRTATFRRAQDTDRIEYDITINVYATPSGFSGYLGTWSSVMSTSQAASLADVFEQTLAKLLRNPTLPARQLSTISASEASVIEFRSADPVPQVNACIHSLFTKCAYKTPDAHAVQAADGILTYKEFETLSNRFAEHLRRHGVTRGSMVPLCVPKSTWLVVAIIGILKAGGVFVPLDFAVPKGRLQHVIARTRAKIVVTALQNREQALGLPNVHVEAVGPKESKTWPSSFVEEIIQSTADDLAYVIFTSGSSGEPKGVMMSHAAACSSIRAHGKAMGFNESTRALHFASLGFDASIAEILTTLLHAGCVCMPSEEERLNNLANYINRMEVNWTFMTPSVIPLLHPDDVPTLKTVVIGGEPLKADIVEGWASRLTLLQAYGPTECCVFSTVKSMEMTTAVADIGHATGTSTWIVNSDHKLAPIGAEGELWLGGPQLAMGYLDDEGKTKQSFVIAPAWGNNERMYRTGDLVKYDQTGSIHFIGRRDGQVKIRGQRVELGEIEASISNSSLKPAQVVVENIKSAGRQSGSSLAAFIVLGEEMATIGTESAALATGRSLNGFTNGNHEDGVKEAHSAYEAGHVNLSNGLNGSHTNGHSTVLPENHCNGHIAPVRHTDDIAPIILSGTLAKSIPHLSSELSRTLPSYMIPAFFIPVQSVPFSMSGKADRRKLRQWAENLSVDDISDFSVKEQGWFEKQPPRTAQEKCLAWLWEEILSLEPGSVDVTDNFLYLGGDSLDAMRLVLTARTHGYSLTVRDVFGDPVLEQMALCLKSTSNQATTEIPEPDLPFAESFEQIKVAASLCQINADDIEDVYPCTPVQEAMMALGTSHPGAYIAQHLFNISSHVDSSHLEKALAHVINAWDALRTRIILPEHGTALQVLLRNGSREISTSRSPLSDVLERDKASTMTYCEPLSRFTIVSDEDTDERFLVWTAQHAVYDGHTVSLFVKHLQESYISDTLPRTTPFKQFISHLQQSYDPKSSKSFWTNELRGSTVPSFPLLPSTSYVPRTNNSKHYQITLPSRWHQGITRSNVVKAAWALTLAQYARTNDVVFGSSMMGRNAAIPGIMDMAGPTIATVPVRVTFDRSQRVEELLEGIQASATRTMPFEQDGLLKISRMSSDTAAACQFKSILSVQRNTRLESGQIQPIISTASHVRTNNQGFNTYALAVEARLSDTGADLEIDFDDRVLSPWNAEHMLQQLGHAIVQLETAQGLTVGELNVLSPQDEAFIQRFSSSVDQRYIDRCNQDLMQEQAHSHPNPPGVDTWPGKLTCDDARAWLADPDDWQRLVPVGTVGEILLGGPLLAYGCFNNDKASKATVAAPPWADSRCPRLYRTGDLACYNEDGSFRHIGRKNDEVTIRGQMVNLGDIEHRLCNEKVVNSAMTVYMPAKGPNKERLVAILALEGHDVVKAVTNHNSGRTTFGLQTLHGPAKDDALPQLLAVKESLSAQLPSYKVPNAWIAVSDLPMTISGKIDRNLLKTWIEALSNETLQSFEIEEQQQDESLLNAMERRIHTLCCDVLGLPRVAMSRSFIASGGDSISAMQLVARCRSQKLKITVQDILQSRSMSELATKVTEIKSIETRVDEQLDQPFDLSPIQKLYFQLTPDGGVGDPERHFNQSFFLRLTRNVELKQLLNAIEVLVHRHSMLRARFKRDSQGQWQQYITANVQKSYRFEAHVVDGSNDGELESILNATQGTINIIDGPLFAVDLLQASDGVEASRSGQRLFLTAHHLVIDVVSWRILLSQLEEILETGNALVEKPITFQTWCALQKDYVHGNLPGEPALVPSPAQVNFSYWGMQDQENVYGDIHELNFTLDDNISTAILENCHGALNTEPADIFTAALLYSFGETFLDRGLPTLYTEGHGRETWSDNIDLSGTLGWFTTISPISIDKDDSLQMLRQTKDQRRGMQSNGLTHFASRLLGVSSREDHPSLAPIELVFNYLGRFQQLEREGGLMRQEALPGNGMSDVGVRARRLALFEVAASVNHGEINFSFLINMNCSHQNEIRAWVDLCSKTLLEFVQRLPTLPREFTRTDLSLPTLTDASLFDLMSDRLPSLGIRVDDVEDIYPCSSIQEGILISQEKTPDHYEPEFVLDVRSSTGAKVDPIRLEKAWRTLVQRHAMLRTVFIQAVSKDQSYDQVVLKNPTLDIEQAVKKPGITNGHCTTIDAPTKARPPHRLVITQDKADGSVVFSMRINHALMDGASMPIMMKELAFAYDGELTSSLGNVYKDYIALRQQQSISAAHHYWSEYLRDIEPCYFPRLTMSDKRSTQRPQVVELNVEEETSRRIAEFGGRTGVTTSNILQIAWALVLRTYTGMDDVCFGCLISERDLPIADIENAIGPFINMLVLRVHFDQDTTARELAERARDDYTDALPHRTYPLAQAQQQLDLAGKKLFNTGISIQSLSTNKDEPHTGSISFHSIGNNDPTEYDITVNLGLADGKVIGDLKYWSYVMTEQQASSVAETFCTILHNLVTMTDRPAASIPKAGVQDIEKIHGWNMVEPVSVDLCLHNIIEQKTIARLDAEAIHSWDGNLSYDALDKLSTTLAHRLVSLGVGPERRVAVCMERSKWTIVSLLAVLKAGGAFVPLDLQHPKSRLEEIIRASNANIGLLDSKAAEVLSDVLNAVVTLPTGDETLERSATPAISTDVRPHNLAYILYTSGSTGKPKGVAISHTAVSSNLSAWGDACRVGESSRVLHFSSIGFDVSILEIFLTLTRGGCVCVPSETERLGDTAGAMERMGVTVAILTPAVATILRPADVPSLKTLHLGGETVHSSMIELWADQVELIVGYGLTETTVVCLSKLQRLQDKDDIRLGRAIGSRVWVVDRDDPAYLAPIGAVGEIVNEGPNIARYYLGDEALTARAFVIAPKGTPGSGSRRAFKTGDLARYADNGEIILVGRRDGQTKIRGQRIELEEVEDRVLQSARSILSNKPVVQVVADVVTPSGPGGSQTLVAFLHVDEDSSINELGDSHFSKLPELDSLPGRLAEHLPRYMVPSAFPILHEMPLTASGKVDKRMLRQWAEELGSEGMTLSGSGEMEKRPPQTDGEKILHRLWQPVLHLAAEMIGADDNFFQLSGDSIKAIQVISALREEGYTLSVGDIFRHPKLTDMALVLKKCTRAVKTIEAFSMAGQSKAALVAEAAQECGTDEDDIEDVYPCTPLQEDMMSLATVRPDAWTARFVYRIGDEVDVARLKQALETTVKAHDILRTRIIKTETGDLMQVVVREGVAWVDVKPGTTVQEYLADDMHQNFGPGVRLNRVAILHEPERQYLVWTTHHSQYDGWASMITLKHISEAYHGVPLSPATPFKAFIHHLQSIRRSSWHTYWSNHLASYKGEPWPSIPPGHIARTTSRARHQVMLPGTGATTRPILLAASWAILLSALTSTEDIAFSTLQSGRSAALAGIDTVCGPTIATVPMRTLVQRDMPITAFLAKMQEDTARGTGYEQAGLKAIAGLGEGPRQACKKGSLFVVQPEGWDQMQASGVLVHDRSVEVEARGTTDYAIVVGAWLGDGDVVLEAEFDGEILGGEEVEGVLRRWGSIARGLEAAEEGMVLGELDVD